MVTTPRLPLLVCLLGGSFLGACRLRAAGDPSPSLLLYDGKGRFLIITAAGDNYQSAVRLAVPSSHLSHTTVRVGESTGESVGWNGRSIKIFRKIWHDPALLLLGEFLYTHTLSLRDGSICLHGPWLWPGSLASGSFCSFFPHFKFAHLNIMRVWAGGPGQTSAPADWSDPS